MTATTGPKKNPEELNIEAKPCDFFPIASCSVANTRLQNDNSVYTLDEKPSWDNVIALIICRGCNRYCLSPQHPSDAHPATSRWTIICTNTEILYLTPPVL